MMSKELFIAAHEELVEEYMEANPEATWDDAYQATGDLANDRYRDKFADMVDAAKQRAKDAGNWPPRK
jgi:hypothetical protein